MGGEGDMEIWRKLAFFITLIPNLILHFVKQLWGSKHYPPGPLRLPFIGSVWRFGFKLSSDTFIKLAKQYGNVYTIWVGNIPAVVLCGFQAVKEANIHQSESFADRPLTPYLKAVIQEREILLINEAHVPLVQFILCWGDGSHRGLLRIREHLIPYQEESIIFLKEPPHICTRIGIAFANGETWKQQRRFGLVALRKLGLGKKGLEHQVEELAQDLVQTFALTKGQPFDPMKPITTSICNVICAMTFAHQFSLKDKEFLKLTEALENLLNFVGGLFHVLYEVLPFVMKRLPGPHQKTFVYVETMLSFIKKEIEIHRENHSQHDPQDFIDFYLLQMEKGKRDPDSTYDDENLSNCILDLFVAGTDTSAGTLQWALLLMASHPDVQEKVQKEIEHVFGSSQIIHYSDRKKLPYTSAVINEIVRYKYIVLFGLPRQTTEDVDILGFFIPKGTMIIPDLRSVLLDPNEWEKPNQFNPHHFLDRDGRFVEREAFLPFGAGARACVGEQLAEIEIFIFFTNLLRAFTFRAPEGVKELNLEPVIGLTTHPHPYKLCAVPVGST